MYAEAEINELIEAWMFLRSNDHEAIDLYLRVLGWEYDGSNPMAWKNINRMAHDGGYLELQLNVPTKELSVCHASWCSSIEGLMHELRELKYYGV